MYSSTKDKGRPRKYRKYITDAERKRTIIAELKMKLDKERVLRYLC